MKYFQEYIKLLRFNGLRFNFKILLSPTIGIIIPIQRMDVHFSVCVCMCWHICVYVQVYVNICGQRSTYSLIPEAWHLLFVCLLA